MVGAMEATPRFPGREGGRGTEGCWSHKNSQGSKARLQVEVIPRALLRGCGLTGTAGDVQAFLAGGAHWLGGFLPGSWVWIILRVPQEPLLDSTLCLSVLGLLWPLGNNDSTRCHKLDFTLPGSDAEALRTPE